MGKNGDVSPVLFVQIQNYCITANFKYEGVGELVVIVLCNILEGYLSYTIVRLLLNY